MISTDIASVTLEHANPEVSIWIYTPKSLLSDELAAVACVIFDCDDDIFSTAERLQ